MCLSDETVLHLLRVDKACLVRTQASGDGWGLLSGSLWGRWPGYLLVPCHTLLGALARASSPGWAGLQHRQHVVSESSCWPVQLSHFSVCDNFTVTLFGGEFTEHATHHVKLYKSEAVGTFTVVRTPPLSSDGTFSPVQRRACSVAPIPSPDHHPVSVIL